MIAALEFSPILGVADDDVCFCLIFPSISLFNSFMYISKPEWSLIDLIFDYIYTHMMESLSAHAGIV